MQRIRFTYKSSKMWPSVFLLLYFRMTGIYVYERFFDSGQEKKNCLLSCLPGGNESGMPDSDDDFDLDLFFVADRTDWEEYKSRYEEEGHSIHRILIVSYKCAIGLPYKAETNYYKECLSRKGQKKGVLLSRIIKKMAEMQIVSPHTRKDLQFCQHIYSKQELWKLSLLGKYFYVAEEDEQYKKIRDKYRLTVNDIFNILRNNQCNWGEARYIHLQYAALNMAYEGDLYCIRNNRGLIYDPHSLVQVCKLILNSGENLKKLKESFYLLLAQIYDDLLKDANMAYEYYLLACKDYNAYIYYRKGGYWQEYAKDYNKAVKYYIKSVSIYPEYYRAWYMLGFCYMMLGRCTEALDVYRNIGQILTPRLDKRQMRPMEIEYMFKAQNQCAYICNKVMNNPQQSIRENFKAVEVWEAIDRSMFFDFFSPDQAIVRKRVKKQLNVSKIYYEIYLLADKIGDLQLKQEYLDKILNAKYLQ